MEKKKEFNPVGIMSLEVILQGKKGSPLVVHNFNEKAKAEIRSKQAKHTKERKDKRDPDAEFLASRFMDGEGHECAPITAIKKSIISAATAFEDLTKVALRQAIFVDSVLSPGAALVPIESHDGGLAVGKKREDAVRLGRQITALSYRAEYAEWRLRLRIEYNSRLVSEEQLCALIDQAGWGVGICEGRPEKSSALGWGRFERVT